ncbi:MAG: aminotransferase class V-fold PLP-dependent enzyme [Hyphomicrobiales bacterium]|nr:aminotransferase class V-fold PLP-dependent enzyme [Hyphomicrobiales bacterium]
MAAPGPHLLQIPGPSNVPERVLRAMARPTIDHRGPEFQALARDVLGRLRGVFGTEYPVVAYPSSATGAWEAALVNTLSPGDRVLCAETGQFSTQWCVLADRLGLVAEVLPGDWRHGADPQAIEDRLRDDRDGAVKAVMVVHNETSTGVASRLPQVRAAMDAAGHGALLLVDTVSSLACTEYRPDDWGVDVTVCGSQKGLMLPPGLGFNAIGPRALAAAKTAGFPRGYWDWAPMLAMNGDGLFPYTPATNLLYGLAESLDMLAEEGLANVFARHRRLSAATRAAVAAWGWEVQCRHPDEHSPSLTAVRVPDGQDADRLRAVILETANIALGNGLGPLKGKVFRIGHLGEINDARLAGVLAGVELGLAAAQAPLAGSGVAAAVAALGRA